MKHFIDGPVIAFDTETTGLDPWHGDKPFAFSFCNENGDTAYFEFEVDPFTRQPIPDKLALSKIRALLEDPKILKVMHNGKFDVRHCDVGWGIRTAGPGGYLNNGGKLDETMFMAHACNTLEPNYRLKYLSKKYGGVDDNDQDELQKATQRLRNRAKKLGWKIAFEMRETPDGGWKKKAVVAADYWLARTLWLRHPEIVPEGWQDLCRKYAVLDAVRTMLLRMFYNELMDELDVRQTYDWEVELWEVIYNMEGRGVRFDADQNEREIIQVLKKRTEHLTPVMEKAWPGFNIDSHPQLRKLIYEKLKIPVNPEYLTDGGKSGNRQPGTSTDAFREIAEKYGDETTTHILRYRGAAKAFGFFTQYRRLMSDDPLNPGGKVLRSDFRQLGPATGRLACARPNIQQVTSVQSSRSAEPVDARTSYGPRPGYLWLHNDYKGMEVRVFADVSKEPTMLKAIAEGREVHDEVCNKGWGGPYNEAGIKECIHVLGFDGSELGTGKQNELVKKVWSQFDIKDWRKLSDKNRWEFAAEWLKSFDWNIVKAQKSIDKKVTKNKGKMVTFAKIYGGGPPAVKDLLRVTLEEATEFMRQYDAAMPRIQEFMYEFTAQARRDGFIRSLWGRRMNIDPDRAYRCVNYLVQGSSADLLKAAMRKTYKWLKEDELDAYLIMSIHDELVFEVSQYELTRKFVKRICDLMEDTEERIGVPMPTDPSVVTHQWNDKKAIYFTEEDIHAEREARIADANLKRTIAATVAAYN